MSPQSFVSEFSMVTLPLVILIVFQAIGSSANTCSGCSSQGTNRGYNPSTGQCEDCYSNYLTYDERLGPGDEDILDIYILYGYFISYELPQSSDQLLNTAEGYTLLEEGSGRPSNNTGKSIFKNNTYVAVCRFCTLYKNHDFVTTDRITVYNNRTFVNFCRNNSDGFFCSDCKEGFYHDLGTRCVECDKLGRDWVLYGVSQLLPITLLFIALFRTKYSLVSGPLNAAMFFAQMISTTMDIDDPQIPLGNITSHAYSLTAVYKLIYGPTNLEFFAPFIYDLCLFHQQSYLYYFIVQYSVALYPLLLVVFVWSLYYLFKCVCARRKIRESFSDRIVAVFTKDRMGECSRNVLASVVFLSYVKFSWLSTLLFTPMFLYDYKNDIAGTVIFLDPHQNYTHGDNRAFIGLAFVCLFFVVLLPTLLLFVRYAGIPRYLSLFSDILEPFQRPFVIEPSIIPDVPVNVKQSGQALGRCYSYFRRNDKQWISGVYFILRILLLVVYLCLPVFTLRFVLQQVICILGAIFFLIARPYPEKWNNVLDTFMFLILALINTLSMYQFYLAMAGRPLNLYVFIVQYIMVYTPLVWLIICIVYRIRLCYKTHGLRHNLSSDTEDDIDGTESIRLTAKTSQVRGYSTLKF